MNHSRINSTISAEEVIFQALAAYSLDTVLPSIVYTLILLVVGLPGNICVLYVYYFRWQRSNTRYFVFSMALLDTINCLVSLPTEVIIMFNMLKFDSTIACKSARFTTYSMNGSSALILLTIAIDRFTHICKPFSRALGPEAAFRMCVASVVFGILLNSPALYVYGTDTTKKIIYNTTIEIKTCLIDDNVDPKFSFYFYVWIFLTFIIIASTITVLYSCIGVKIWNRRKFPTEVYTTDSSSTGDQRTQSFSEEPSISDVKRKSSKRPVNMEGSRRWVKTKPRTGKSTLSLFIITVLYYVSYFPFLILVVIRYAAPEYVAGLDKTGVTLYHLFLRSYQLNSAVNPVVYSFYNDQFRKHVYTILNKIFCRS